MPCKDKNPLIREGTNAVSRVLAALSSEYARVDERSNADLILFAKCYASYLSFFDTSSVTPAGDWESLMKMDLSVTLATLSSIDVLKISEYKKIIFKEIKLLSRDSLSTDDAIKSKFKFIFDLLFSLVFIIDEQFKLIPGDLEYQQIIKTTITNKASVPWSQLKNFRDKLSSQNLINDASIEIDGNAPLDVKPYSAAIINTFSNEWTAVVDAIDINPPGTVKDKINAIINHNLFAEQVDALLNAIAIIVSKAKSLFEQTIIDFPSHQPYYGLFLSFLRLFKIAQDELNAYTRRHLDFYYKEVLQLKNKNPEPDSAHVVIELQKTIAQHLLTQNTLFNAGEDSAGQELKYELKEDTVLSQALITSIHALLVAHGEKDLVYASPIADSEDGQGAKIISPDKSWFAFGKPLKENLAQPGFAIASPVLFLNEGLRTITVKCNFESAFEPAGIAGLTFNCFKAKISGKKGWYTINSLDSKYDSASNQMSFTFILQANEPAFIAYSEKIHKEKFDTELPLLKIFLDQSVPGSVSYTAICRKKITSVSVNVRVTGVKDLALSSDAGAIDASKPFRPFGDFPEEKDSFYIGSKEIFQKKITKLYLNVNWKTATPSSAMDIKILKNGDWVKVGNSNLSRYISFAPDNNYQPSRNDFSANEPLSNNSIDGFLRLFLTSSLYSYNTFLDATKTALNKTTIKKIGSSPPEYQLNITPPPQPDYPTVYDFNIDYEADDIIEFNSADVAQLYQLTPFGNNQVSTALIADSVDAGPTEKITLMPDLAHDGELMIGLSNGGPDQVVNILFQLAEGSSNPLKTSPTVNWFYLGKNNNWIEFKPQSLVDRTKDFTTSGIVSITLPADISNETTIVEKGLYWIKAGVTKDVDAVCKMIMIKAQAIRVELVQDEKEGIEFTQVLKSNSISKLTISDAAVKAITQPFDSFNGRPRETDDHFYTRVSERLRHKQRAVSIWDYEHIILEKFPKIQKVRCLNHSGFYTKDDKEIFCENYPGHVTIITTPNLENQTNINPLRPYTPIGLRTAIKEYLLTIMSPFVRLEVRNPLFEEIQLEFNVMFRENFDPSFYRQLLDTEIEKFLCPWAYDPTKEISFGGKIIKSALLNFIEERPYVDFVTDFNMYQIVDKEMNLPKVDTDEAIPSTSMSILVSYFNEDLVNPVRHIIYSPAVCECQ